MTHIAQRRFLAQFPNAYIRRESNGQNVVYSDLNRPLVARRDTDKATWEAALAYVEKTVSALVDRGITFDHEAATGLHRFEIITRARLLQAELEERFGSYSIQQAIDGVIDAAIEHAQS